MKVLILGGNGMLGPWTIEALEARHDLRVTDINDPPAGFKHDYVKLDASDLDGVVDAADGMDVIVNLSVLREDRKLAFDVSTRGNYNMMVAARKHGIGRVVNTGPPLSDGRAAIRRMGLWPEPRSASRARDAPIRTKQGVGPGDHSHLRRTTRHPGANAPLLQHDAPRHLRDHSG